ncbi:hypothetical protein GF318_04185 [Candidatus Micrarchaeota archaeon]|nr:hypothetical protein [Candidatus Micrarchaeota archaeon]
MGGDRYMTTLHQKALAHNRRQVTTFETSVLRRMRARTFSDPHTAKQRALLVLNTRMAELQPKLQEARGVLSRIKERKRKGELPDELCEGAEEMSAQVVLTLGDMLGKMHRKARQLDDRGAPDHGFLLTVRVTSLAADLLDQATKDLLREDVYAGSREDRERVATNKINDAVSAYRDVLGALRDPDSNCSANQEWGIPDPSFPSIKDMH